MATQVNRPEREDDVLTLATWRQLLEYIV
ncbi:hypothetical protein [Dryocola sp. BD613]